MVSFVMFGIFFVMPQYFQEVRGADAMGSGLRLLPMIGGMIIGMIGGTRLASARRTACGAADEPAQAPRVSAKLLVTIGFTLMAAALAIGAGTSASSGTGFAAAWFAVFGLGLDLAMPQAMNAAIGALSAERSGAGSALISALRQVGATIGVAVLGTILGSVYRGHLALTGLPRRGRAGRREEQRGSGRRRRAPAELGSAARLGAARVRFRHGRDAVDLRRDRAGERRAGGHLPAAAGRGEPRSGPGRVGAAPNPAGTDVVRGESVPERAELEA